MYEYTGIQWILFFFCYCFFGWIFESTYVSLKKRHFVNRGFLRLPMLPLYGTGAVMMLFVSLPVKDNLFLVYFSGVIAATLLEYVTGWGMEQLFKMRYWDYSSQHFQLHGYICLSSSIAWGFLTIFLTEVIHRPVERLVLGINPVLAAVLAVGMGTVFTADVVESTKAALDLGRALEAMTRMKAEMEEMQVQLALLKSDLRDQIGAKVSAAHGEASQHLEEILAEAAARMKGIRESSAARAAESTAAAWNELKEELAERLENWRETAVEHREDWIDNAAEYREQHRQKIRETAEKIIVLRERMAALNQRHKQTGSGSSPIQAFYRKGLLLGNPTAFSQKYTEALTELRKRIEEIEENPHSK